MGSRQRVPWSSADVYGVALRLSAHWNAEIRTQSSKRTAVNGLQPAEKKNGRLGIGFMMRDGHSKHVLALKKVCTSLGSKISLLTSRLPGLWISNGKFEASNST